MSMAEEALLSMPGAFKRGDIVYTPAPRAEAARPDTFWWTVPPPQMEGVFWS